MQDLAAEQDRAVRAAVQAERATPALRKLISPQDRIALLLVLVAFIAGFAGGCFFGPGWGFLVLSIEALVVAILIGMS